MTPEAIFQRYRAERCSAAVEGFELEVLPYLSRYTARNPTAEGFVQFAALPPGRELLLIEEQSRFFAQRGQRFEWKIYELDQPDNLKALLETRGFVGEEPEAFMVLPAQARLSTHELPPGIEIRSITDERALQDVIALQADLFREDFGWLFEIYAHILSQTPPRAAMYGAYDGPRAVATGWIDLPAGSQFADLHGGAVLPEYRGRGIFSALVARRQRDAVERGYAFLAVDAAPMSRPILERQGFQHICWTHPMRRQADAARR